MQKFRPYDIIHVNLFEPENLQLPPGNNRGKYIVVWWKEIALGHFFIAPEIAVDDKAYKAQIVSALNGAMQSYEKKINGVCLDWQTLLLNQKGEDWQDKLKQILEPFMLQKFPEKVPVSVIICTRNRHESLHTCLDFLQKSISRPHEIIVVDNAPSDDNTFNVVTHFEKIIYVKEPRLGLDIARNTGIKNASSAVVAFTDDDVQVHPLWIYRIWETFQPGMISAMAGLVIAAQLETEAQYIFEKHWSFNRGFVDKLYDKNFFKNTFEDGPPVWEIGAGANMAFRKSIFEEVGLFNELLDVGAAGCNGDSEMWYRILKKGHAIAYNPRAVTFHTHRKEMKALKKQIFFYMRGFAAAALLQQKQSPGSGYKKRVFVRLPRYYFSLIKKGFPFYRSQFQTLSSEMKGIVSGLRYFYKNF